MLQLQTVATIAACWSLTMIHLSVFLSLSSCEAQPLPMNNNLPFMETSNFADATDGKFFFPRDDDVIGPLLGILGQWEQPMKDMVYKILGDITNRTSDSNSNCTLTSSSNSCSSKSSSGYPIREDDLVVFDIGANFGTYSVPIGKAFPLGRVFAFEAQLQMMNYLHTNLLANDVTNCYPFHVILSNVSGSSIPLDSVADISGSSNLHNYGGYSISDLSATEKSKRSVLVPQLRLDDLYLEKVVPCPHFMKMDVEFHEMFVFLGARQLLHTCKPIIIFEADCKHLVRSLLTLLDHIGYDMMWIGLPRIDLQRKHKGKSAGEFGDSVFQDRESGIRVLDNGINILAVPRERTNAHSLPSIFAADGAGIVPGLRSIDVRGGRFVIDSYDIQDCYHSHWCYQKIHAGDEDGLSCAGEKLSEYIVDYWKFY